MDLLSESAFEALALNKRMEYLRGAMGDLREKMAQAEKVPVYATPAADSGYLDFGR